MPEESSYHHEPFFADYASHNRAGCFGQCAIHLGVVWLFLLVIVNLTRLTGLPTTVLTKTDFLVMEGKNLWVLCLSKGELHFLALPGQINLLLLTKSLVSL